MATSTTSVVAKPKFVNRNAKIAGQETITNVLDTLREARMEAQSTAMEALGAGNRKGVLITMRIDGTYARAISSLERAIVRAQRVRLSKDQRAQYALDGTLPQGYELVTVADDDDDDDDDDA